ncbi:MAG: hypothetical protein A3H07_00995 [Candidatus Jacksonbacteria bacterium RIFCSPLOWO2_12_FULL_44_15b]|nr:MAG: hypothetical protein A3H07_00995 [Candidatus Jacksonbacteria bacterium RIFCSPLOWO2_12_FULL_44_15b]
MNISFDPTFWRTAEIGEIIAQFFILAFVMLAVFFIFGLIARAWLMWRRSLYRKSVSFITYAIDIPPEEIKTPKAMENLISQLYAIKSKFNTFEKWWKGQYTLQTSLEIIAQDGYVQFCAYVPHKYEYLFKKAVYAQFSDAHISEIEDYAKAILTDDLISSNPAGRYELWGTEFMLTAASYYPIRTYSLFSDASGDEFADPLASLLEMMSHLHRGERFWYQVTITPTRKAWQKAGMQAIRDTVEGVTRKKLWVPEFLIPFFRIFADVMRLFIYSISPPGESAKPKKGAEKILTMVPPEHELIIKAMREKLSRLGFSAHVRALYIAETGVFDKRQVAGDFQGIMRQFANPQMNSLASDMKVEVDFPQFLFPKTRAKWRKRWLLERAQFRYSGIGADKPRLWQRIKADQIKNILSVEELSGLWHFPIPEIADKLGLLRRVSSRKVHPKQLLPEGERGDSPGLDADVTFFAQTNYRALNRRFGIRQEDRRRHMYVIGKTGMGKTTLLENMIYQDIMRGEGVAVIDPHGDLAESVIDLIPQNRINDVVYFNPADQEYPIAFNIIGVENEAHRYLISSALVGIFKKIWADSWGPRLEYLLRNSLLTLLETRDNTILGVPRLFVDASYRKRLVKSVKDPVVRTFWESEYAKYNQTFQVEAVSPIQNKIGQFTTIPMIRNMIGQVQSKVNFREILDERKILIVNLAKGLIGEDVSALLGATIISKLQIAAMMRADRPESERQDFYMYIDEFQNFSTDSFAVILSEARKYRLNLVMAHQYIEQLDEMVAAAVFGNVGTSVVFGVGAEDARVLEAQYEPEFIAQDLVNLGKHEVVLRLMIDGATSRPFSAATLPPLGAREVSSRDKIIRASRERYSTPREVIEEKLQRWLALPSHEEKKLLNVNRT